MKRRSVEKAFEHIRPDEAARERMLRNVLNSSEIPPAGKDDTMKRKRLRPLVIAAIIGMMVMLMGCAVVIMGLHDLKIGEITTYGEIFDSEGNVPVEKELTGNVISLHGFTNSPTYFAHQDWFAFYDEYQENHEITEEENFYVPPEEYEAYTAYNQELQDKIDEIARKYDLKLLGAFAPFQRWERSVFYEATGLDTLLKSDSVAEIDEESGYFYQGGNFKVDFHMTMPDSNDYWPYVMLNTMYYSKADYFDTVYSVIWNEEEWDQWNYTTSSDTDLLIAKAKSGYGAKVYHNRDDALIYVNIDTSYENADGEIIFMTKRQLEQIAEQFDYTLNVEEVDIDLAKAELERFNNVAVQEPDSTGNQEEPIDQDKYGYREFIEAGIAAAKHPEKNLYVLTDIDDNGIVDLLLGGEEQCSAVWTIKQYENGNSSIALLSYAYTEDEWAEVNTVWYAMEKKAITEYLSE